MRLRLDSSAALRSAQNDIRIIIRSMSVIPRREHRHHRWPMFAPLNDVLNGECALLLTIPQSASPTAPFCYTGSL